MADLDHRLTALTAQTRRAEDALAGLQARLTRLETLLTQVMGALQSRDEDLTRRILGRVHMEQSFRNRGL